MENKLYLIAFKQNIREINVLKDRIGNLGEAYYLFDGNILLLHTHQQMNAQQVYSTIAENGFEDQNILVLTIENSLPHYFGFMSKQLWEWMKDQNRDVE